MREDSFPYTFNAGLRTKGQGPRNSAGLELCHNLKVHNGRLAVVGDVVTPSGAAYVSLFDRVFVGQDANYACCGSKIYICSSAMSVIATATTTAPVVPWSFADFGPYGVFTNGHRLYVVSPTTGAVSAYSGSALLVCRTIANYRGQLVCGSPTGYDPNVVLWGDIGYAQMSMSDSVVAGYMPMPWSGYVYDVRPFGSYVAVYGQDGVALLRAIDSSPPGFGLLNFSSVGLKSVGAIGGSLHKQLHMRSDGQLVLLVAEKQRPHFYEIKELDYGEWFADWTVANISYNEAEDEFYLTDGVEAYVLTTEGLSSTSHLISTCVQQRGTLYGLSQTSTDTSAYVRTQVLDLGLRGRKDIEVIEVGGDGYWRTQVEWKNRYSTMFQPGPIVATNPMGTARNKVSGEEFKIKLLSTSADATLDYMIVRLKRTDKRFVRGLDASQAAAKSDK